MVNIVPNVKNILMVRPKFFNVKYSINPWMDINNPVDTEKAMKQWENLKTTIEKAGAAVHIMEPEVSYFKQHKPCYIIYYSGR